MPPSQHARKLICVSDLHLAPPGQMLHQLDPEARMRACFRDIADNHADAICCVILGDLAHKADPAAYGLLRDALSMLPMPVHLMIGNHDRRETLRAGIPDVATDAAGFIQSSFDTDIGRFILTDTVEEGQDWGRYCSRRQDWLREELAAAGERPVYLFMHHPPFDCGIPCLDRIGQRDGDALADILRGNRNIRHLFLGHVHRPMAGSWLGLPFSSARGTNHQVPFDLRPLDHVPKSHEPPAYSIAFIDEDRVVVHFHDYLDRSRL
jgi:3',5'-cyclic-AMP phosphodiesterase